MFAAVSLPCAAAPTAEQALATGKALTAVATARCVQGRADEIIVCGRDKNRYRLPLRNERDPDESRPRAGGDIPRASADVASGGDCGLFKSQRRCTKAESRAYGLGGGNDPLSFFIKLGKKLADPDADVGATAPVPDNTPKR
jgi:hypothetical protein